MPREITEENRRRIAEWEAEHKNFEEKFLYVQPEKKLDVTPEAIAERQAAGKNRTGCIVMVVLAVFACVVVPLIKWQTVASESAARKASWTCSEFDSPLEVVQLRGGKVTVFAGATRPQPDNIQGYAGTDGSTGAMVGITAQCTSTRGTYYYVRGTQGGGTLWRGWIRQSDIQR